MFQLVYILTMVQTLKKLKEHWICIYSAMYDGSALPYEINAANTRTVADLASQYSASVEAEIGSMGAEQGRWW